MKSFSIIFLVFLVVSTIEPGRKQMDSENGESVNGDAMLDVEMDKESAVAGSSSTTATERLVPIASHTTTSADEITTTTENTAPEETIKENRDEDVKDTDDAMMTEQTSSSVTPKDDAEHKLIDIEGNESLENFKADETDSDEQHINVVDEDRDNKESSSSDANKTAHEDKKDAEKEINEEQATNEDADEKSDTDTEKLKNIFEIIADPFVNDDDDDEEQTDETSSDSLEVAGSSSVVGSEEETKNKSNVISSTCIDDDAESKTNSADELDTSTQSESVKPDECSPSAAKIPRLSEDVTETSTKVDDDVNDGVQETLADSDAMLKALEPNILSDISSSSQVETTPTEVQQETEQLTEEKEEIPLTETELKTDDAAASVSSESMATTTEEPTSVLSPSALDISIATDELEKIIVPEIIAADANVEALLAAAVDPIESPIEAVVFKSVNAAETPAEVPTKSIEEPLLEIQQPLQKVPIVETVTAITAEGITENPEKMSIEEMDNQAAPIHLLSTPPSPSSSSTAVTPSGESAMEAAPIIPSSIADDEQMDVDESNSIDSMDL